MQKAGRSLILRTLYSTLKLSLNATRNQEQHIEQHFEANYKSTSNYKWRHAHEHTLKKQSNWERGFNKLIMLIWAFKRHQLGLILATLVVSLTLLTIIAQSNASSTTTIADDQQANQTHRFPKQTNQQQQQQQQRRQVSLVNHNWRWMAWVCGSFKAYT